MKKPDKIVLGLTLKLHINVTFYVCSCTWYITYHMLCAQHYKTTNNADPSKFVRPGRTMHLTAGWSRMQSPTQPVVRQSC